MDRRWSWTGAAVLFDMDGTLLDSGASVLRAWHWLAAELELPADTFDGHLHGIPAVQVLAELLPWLAEPARVELADQLNARQSLDSADVLAVPGALAALEALPTSRWAIVTRPPGS